MISVAKSDTYSARFFVEMILISASYFPELFGEKIRIILEKLFIKENNIFSFQHVLTLKRENEIAAMILCYDYNSKRKENLRTGLLLFKYLKFSLLKKTLTLIQFNKTIGTLKKSDYYISNITTFEKFRHQGFARSLLLEAEKGAKTKKSKKMVLDVEKENNAAINLYKSLGYVETNEYNIILN